MARGCTSGVAAGPGRERPPTLRVAAAAFPARAGGLANPPEGDEKGRAKDDALAVMRSLVYAVLTASLFAAVLYFGGGALGVWDELHEVPRAAAEPSTTAADPAAPAAQEPARR